MNLYPDYEIMIARICHEANRAFCSTQGDQSQTDWDQAPNWQRDSACLGVSKILSGEITKPEESHESWSKTKREEGWVWGKVKDPEKKTHPCLLPFGDLPVFQKQKDYLFFAIVKSFGRLL